MLNRSCSILYFLVVLLVTPGMVNANSDDVNKAMAHSHRLFFPGELLVKFKQDVSVQAREAVHRRFNISEKRAGYNNLYQIISVLPGREREIAKAYLKRPEIAYAEPNYYRTVYATPNDELYRYQWNLPLINMAEAWDVSTGEGVTVAIIDTGVNPFGRDGFGSFSDSRLLRGYNAIMGIPGAIDFEGHGTHVAGTVGQETNNVVGVAGVAYGANILPVKVLSFLGSGLDSWIIRGIRWATDQGADIINLSLGFYADSQALEDAVNYAYENGVTVIAAAGNDGEGEVMYPAAFENCISVGAVGYDKGLADYSNYGDALDLVAPGGDNDTDLNGDGYGDGVLQETFGFFGLNWGYWYYTGTSMASPHVAGIAALVKSLHPDYGPDEIRQVLQDTAQDLGDPGWDERYGHGLVDAFAAVSY
ncbi:MAG: S8 family peptidase [Thermodesulfobacteriota bacterium]|nr:S8 family peptidase [Thermodesulfobacteriota bacterium]